MTKKIQSEYERFRGSNTFTLTKTLLFVIIFSPNNPKRKQ